MRYVRNAETYLLIKFLPLSRGTMLQHHGGRYRFIMEQETFDASCTVITLLRARTMCGFDIQPPFRSIFHVNEENEDATCQLYVLLAACFASDVL